MLLTCTHGIPWPWGPHSAIKIGSSGRKPFGALNSSGTFWSSACDGCCILLYLGGCRSFCDFYRYIYILGADDTGLCGQFSWCFLAHDMGFMYRFCYGFFFTHDMGVMRRPNGQVFFHFIDRWHGNKWSNLHMTWDFQEDTDVQDGKWQVNSFKFL